MILTNKMKLPEPLVRAIAKSIEKPHNEKGHYSVTTLQTGIRQTILTERHYDEIETDVSDEIWALFGTAVHSLLEREAKPEDEAIAEMALNYEIPEGIITGKSDLVTLGTDQNDPLVEDYKTCKAFAVMFPDTAKRWREQLACYCALLDTKGIKVRNGRVLAFLKDWSPAEAVRRGADYPEKPVVVFRWKYSDKEINAALADMVDKVQNIKSLENTADDELPMCTPEERWTEPTKYAITKIGNQKAAKVCDTMEEALELIKTSDRYKYGCEIVAREGRNVKCHSYCKAAKFCNFFKEDSKEESCESQ